MEVKKHVRGYAAFVYFRDGALWYVTDSGLLFPVPVIDAGSATFRETEKAITLMRWIRKQIKELENEQ